MCVCLSVCICLCVQGRHTEVVSLTRPLSGGLGFSVVGLNPAGSSSHGVFVKHIQPGGIAHRCTDTHTDCTLSVSLSVLLSACVFVCGVRGGGCCVC